jgi:hypothetical protein
MYLSQFNYRVKPQSGDSTIIERVTGNTISNTGTGTVTVVDRGSGDMCLRVSGGTMLLALPTSLGLINVSSGSGDLGITVVARVKAQTIDGSSSTTATVLQVGSTAATSDGVGVLRYGSAGQALARGSWATQVSADTALSLATERIVVVRMLPNNAADSGFDTFDTWITGGSGSGNLPDFTTTGGNRSGITASHFASGPLATSVWDIADALIYRPTSGANLTDAQCRSFITLGIDAAITADSPPSGPTINTQPTAQAVNEGSTATFTVAATASAGSLTYQWKRANRGSGTFSAVSGATSASYTTAATDCATDHGAQYQCAVTDSNGTTTTSNALLTVRSVTTVSRPVSDVTPAGWTASTGVDLYATVDEVSASSTDYMQSPTITATPVWCVLGLDYPIASGNRTVGVMGFTDTGTATMKVRLQDDSGTVVGSAADQAVTATPTSYNLAITLSGPATRLACAFVS